MESHVHYSKDMKRPKHPSKNQWIKNMGTVIPSEYHSIRKKETLLFAKTWKKFEDFMQRDTPERGIKILYDVTYAESEKLKLVKSENT